MVKEKNRRGNNDSLKSRRKASRASVIWVNLRKRDVISG